MPKFNHPTLGDIQSFEYLRGKIVSIETAADTCVLSTGETALIFYH